MAKYIDAEKLKAEIERELSAHDKVDHLEAFEVGKAWSRGHKVALKNLKSFIDSLQQEQPEVDLEKEYSRYMASRKDDVSGYAVTVNMKDLARHFYELGLNVRKEE